MEHGERCEAGGALGRGQRRVFEKEKRSACTVNTRRGPGNGERKDAYRIALNALYSSPMLSRLPLRLLCGPSARKAFKENSSSAMSVVS